MNKTIVTLTAVLFFLLVLVLGGCDKKVGMREGTVVAPPVGFCDTITYAKHIKPIIDNNCATVGCHVTGGAGNGVLVTYADVLIKVNNGTFKSRVFDSPNNPMPASGMLPQKQLDIIKCWLDKGALNN